MDTISELGGNLSRARKAQFPADGMRGFAPRIGVSVTTLVKMEQGQLSVALGSYYAAAKVLGLTEQFHMLFAVAPSLFDDSEQ